MNNELGVSTHCFAEFSPKLMELRMLHVAPIWLKNRKNPYAKSQGLELQHLSQHE